MRRVLAAWLVLFACAFAPDAQAQTPTPQLVDCAPGVPCDPSTGPSTTGTGEPAWKDFGKINSDIQQLYSWMTGLANSVLTLTNKTISGIANTILADVMPTTAQGLAGDTQLMTCTGNFNATSAALTFTYTPDYCALNPSRASPSLSAADIGKTIATTGRGTSNASVSALITSQSLNTATGNPRTLSGLTGTGTNGTYTAVALTGGSGSGALATVVVAGGVVTSATITAGGSAYLVGNVLAFVVPGGSGTAVVATVGPTQTIGVSVANGATLANATVLIGWGHLGDSAAINAAAVQTQGVGGKLKLASGKVFGLDAEFAAPTTGISNIDMDGAILVCLKPMANAFNVPQPSNFTSTFSSYMYGGGIIEGMGLCGTTVNANARGWHFDHIFTRDPTTENFTLGGNFSGSYITFSESQNMQPGAPGTFNTALLPLVCVDNTNNSAVNSDNHFIGNNCVGAQNHGFWWQPGSAVAHAIDNHVWEIANPGGTFFQLDSQVEYSGGYVDNLGQTLPTPGAPTPTGQIGIDITNGKSSVTDSFCHYANNPNQAVACIRIASNLDHIVVKGNNCFGTTGPDLSVTPMLPGILELGNLTATSDVDPGAGCLIASANFGQGLISLGGGATQLADVSGSAQSFIAAFSLPIVTFYSSTANTYTNGAATFRPRAPICAGLANCPNLYAIQTPDNVAFSGGMIVNGGTAGINSSLANATNIGSNQFGSLKMPALISVGTKFTAAGCSASSTLGGAGAGIFTLGANSCTAIITINGVAGMTATNGWSCTAHDRNDATVLIGGESASTTTTASFAIPASAGIGHVISYSCTGY
jgi:hypothetical protein